MNKFLLFCSLFLSSALAAQELDEVIPSTFSISINQDNAFGFYPAVYGSWGLDDKLSFTYYSIFWTNPSYGTPSVGSDLWLETGVGISFGALNDQILINPSLGFTHGKLLSGGVEGVPFEGFVPSIVGFLETERVEGEFFFAYYKALQQKGLPSDFILYWAYPGIKLSDRIAVGLHYEQFALTRITGGEPESFYRWLGGYLKFTINNQYSLRFSVGQNLDTGLYSSSYYKLMLFIPLL